MEHRAAGMWNALPALSHRRRVHSLHQPEPASCRRYGRARQPCKNAVPLHHVARYPHADERRHRHDGDRQAPSGRRWLCEGLSGQGLRVEQSPADAGQRYFGYLQGRKRQDDARPLRRFPLGGGGEAERHGPPERRRARRCLHPAYAGHHAGHRRYRSAASASGADQPADKRRQVRRLHHGIL